MKESRFADGQIIESLKRVKAGLMVLKLCRALGDQHCHVSQVAFLCNSMDVPIMARIKALESENTRLHEMYVGEKLMAEIVQEELEKMVGLSRRREIVHRGSTRVWCIDLTGRRCVQHQ